MSVFITYVYVTLDCELWWGKIPCLIPLCGLKGIIGIFLMIDKRMNKFKFIIRHTDM